MTETSLANLLPYLPMDRRLSIASGDPLPARATGAAVFIDISGFTALTDTLVRSLGPQRAAEELTALLDRVYEVVIAQIHRYHGSVIAFAGDAITCWFGDDNGHRAAGAALAIHTGMLPFRTFVAPGGDHAAITVKASVAVGPVSRFVVGDPRLRQLDVIAGDTLTRLGRAEALAAAGETLLDPGALAALADVVHVEELRRDPSGAEYGVLIGLQRAAAPDPWPEPASDGFSLEQIRPWVLPSLVDRIAHGPSEMLAELRSTVALFVRFAGIDFDRDPDAGAKLDTFVRQVQDVLEYHAGTLIDINFGDKGSYLYVNFGAPVTHEDNTARACDAALALASIPNCLDYLTPLQIGISRGRMRAGAYGASSQRTYGVLGEEVNMAARIMMTAAPGEIRVSSSVREEAGDAFSWQDRPPIQPKGRADLVPVFCLVGRDLAPATEALRNRSTGPLAGREDELALLTDSLREADLGNGHLVTLFGEAGIGKSRLALELAQIADDTGFMVLSGACDSRSVKDSYHLWRPIFRAILGIPAGSEPAAAEAIAARWLSGVDPRLVRRLPLLGPLLGMEFAETDVTRSLDPQLRKLSLESLLVEILNASARDRSLLLVLDDCQWIDELSLDLLLQAGRGLAVAPALLLVISRPDEVDTSTIQIAALGNNRTVRLGALPDQALARLAHMWLDTSDTPRPPGLAERLVKQAEGSPLYLEELVRYVRNQGELSGSTGLSATVELPSNMQNLVLSRVDRLPDQHQVTLKVASVLGRTFASAWLRAVYPSRIPAETFGNIVAALCLKELLVPEHESREPTYAFRNGLIQTAVYEALPHSTRSTLHERIGLYMEERFTPLSAPQTRLLAQHFLHTGNTSRKRKYLALAAEEAQAQYANDTALYFYEHLLPEIQGEERIRVLRKLGEIKQLTGHWPEAEARYADAIALARQLHAAAQEAWAHVSLAELERLRGQYAAARTQQDTAMALFDSIGDEPGVAQVLHIRGTALAQQGEYQAAVDCYTRSLDMRRRLGDRDGEAKLLSNLAIISEYQGDLEESLALHEAALAIRRGLDDLQQLGNSLNNVGHILLSLKRMEPARQRLVEAVEIQRDLGALWALANGLNNLGNVYRDLGDRARAGRSYAESLALQRSLLDDWSLAYLFEDIAQLAVTIREDSVAIVLYSAATKMRDTIDAPLPPPEQEAKEKLVAAASVRLTEDERVLSAAKGARLTRDEAISFALALVDVV